MLWFGAGLFVPMDFTVISLASKSITTSLYTIMSSASHWKLNTMTWNLNTIRSQVFEIVAIWLQPCCYGMCVSLWTTFQWNDHLVLLFIRQYNSLISHQYLIIIPCKPVWVVPPSVSQTWGCLSPASLNSLSTQRSCRGFAIIWFVWCSPGQVRCGDNVCCCKANLSLENTHQIKLIYSLWYEWLATVK